MSQRVPKSPLPHGILAVLLIFYGGYHPQMPANFYPSVLTCESIFGKKSHAHQQSADSNVSMTIIYSMKSIRRRITIENRSVSTIRPCRSRLLPIAGESNETKHRPHPECITRCYRRERGGDGS
eukprot:scaffold12676_cov114-Skeletonema_menzelii.AAC.2